MLLRFAGAIPIASAEGAGRCLTYPLVRSITEGTVHLLCRLVGGPGGTGGYSWKADQSNPGLQLSAADGLNVYGDAVAGGPWCGGSPLVDGCWHVWSAAYKAGAPSPVYIDGAKISDGHPINPPNGVASIAQTAYSFGHLFAWTGQLQFGGVAYYGVQQSDAVVRQFVDWCRWAFDDLIALEPTPTVLFIGNSMMADASPGYTDGVASLCLAAQATYARSAMLWKAGYGTAHIRTRTAEEIGQLLTRYPGPVAVVHFCGGTDRVNEGLTPAQIYAELGGLADDLHAVRADTRVIIPTYISRQGYPHAEKVTLNGLILADAGNHFDHVCDLTGINDLSGDGAELNGAFFADQVHLTDAGALLLQGALSPVIAAALA